MKQKGFTMIELLGVIVVLGLLAAIIYPIINGKINDSKDDLYESQIVNIEKGARNWGADHMGSLPTEEGQKITLTIGQLQEEGYLDDNIENPKTKEKFSSSIIITIEIKNNSLEYTVGA